MVFSSLLFIYIFLPVNLLCYAMISDIRKKNNCVLAFSLLFYAWTSPKYLVVLMFMAGINYVGALLIEKNDGNRMAKVWLGVDVALSLLVLGFFKYLGFVSELAGYITGVHKTILHVVLPVGISFYTFQLISYVVDVYRHDIKADHSYKRVLLYASLFHQCIAGPIVRYKDIARSLDNRKTGISDMSEGITRFVTGLAKKTLLANSCAALLNSFLPETLSGISHTTVLSAWIGALLYMLEIYLDFSAYSDMAIGLGKMTGFCYKENFNYPYTATSVTDFWRKWHISLSTFFRDYVYIPLGGNRKGIARQIINMFIVWALTGLWHGASMNFVVWGLYFFVFLILEKLVLLRTISKLPALLSKLAGWVYTFLVVIFGWVLFRFTDFALIRATLKAMLGLNGNPFTNMETNTMLLNNIIFIIVAIAASTPLFKWLTEKLKNKGLTGNVRYTFVYNSLNIIVPVLLLFLSTVALIGNSYNPFIYFRF